MDCAVEPTIRVLLTFAVSPVPSALCPVKVRSVCNVLVRTCLDVGVVCVVVLALFRICIHHA